ncbi:uncharacterized protein HD556DRAFT_1307019 [Suillus plorans]|uniref:DUF6533 domain-containing protein n=1 Tax=Suillus plorans TaxID=116603 RepID=A0A9P7DJT1_9AGAM|nr:uncharacterized protein HD556DRAFT_1307019 [Suillus plorans]KAG1796266.1 hypothetical protein HD556DRAFT_1307019 [Suillus plorans]
MVLVSNDPSWWPVINANLIGSYFSVAASAAVTYDWGLTFGQEVELIWTRYLGIGFIMLNMSSGVPTIWTTDAGCLILYNTLNWMGEVVEISLGVIMIVRLHAMYQRSRKVLVFLVVTFLVTKIANVVIVAITTTQLTGEEYILSSTYLCNIDSGSDFNFLSLTTWILDVVWEVLVMCLAVWIAVKHFRELRRHSAGGIIGDCFTVLMQTHVSYFASHARASFLAISCFEIALVSPTLGNVYSLGAQIYLGFAQIFQMVQMSVLGPRLILGVREYHAKLVADSDTASAMISIAFQERVHVETSSSV